MAGFDRSAFRGANSRVRKQQIEEVESKSPQSSNSKFNYLKLTPGKNYIRLFPIHPKTIENLGEDASNMYPYATHFLNTETEYEGRDGKTVKETKRRPHLSSKIHGNTEKCVIDEYIKYAFKIAYNELSDEKEINDFLKPIKDWKTGIGLSTKWCTYAKAFKDKSKSSFERGLLQLPVSVVNKLNELSAEDDDADDVIETDIFSDPDNGYLVIITSDPEAGKKDPKLYYQVALAVKEGPDKLSDDDLEWLEEQTPLDEAYLNIYKREDFFRTLDSLKAFDKEHNLGIFSEDEFLDICEEISSYYPEEEESEDKKEEEKKSERKISTVSKRSTPKKDTEEHPHLKDNLPWDIDEMDREGLKSYIKENSLSIRVLERYSDDDIREFIREEEAIISASKKKEVKEEEEEQKPEPTRRRGLDRLRDSLED